MNQIPSQAEVALEWVCVVLDLRRLHDQFFRIADIRGFSGLERALAANDTRLIFRIADTGLSTARQSVLVLISHSVISLLLDARLCT